MSETIKREQFPRIKFSGIFDWEELHGLMYGWFEEKKYDYFEEKNNRKLVTYGYERDFICHAEREETGYTRHDIDIQIRLFHAEDVEIIVDGEKKKKTKAGLLVIDIKPSIKLDWQDKWSSGTKKKAASFFHKYIITGFILEQLDKVYYEAYKLHTEIKTLLEFESKYSAYSK